MPILPRYCALFVLVCTPALAETIRLKSGEVVEGKIQEMTEKQITISVGSSKRQIARDQIVNIDFTAKPAAKTPTPQPTPKSTPQPSTESETFLRALSGKSASKYKTPLETFQVWKNAAILGDMDGMVDCYVSYQQKDVRKQLKNLSKDDREKMRIATARTNFVPAKPFYQGDRALLEVNWQNGLQSDTQLLQFILEKSEWKLIQ